MVTPTAVASPTVLPSPTFGLPSGAPNGIYGGAPNGLPGGTAGGVPNGIYGGVPNGIYGGVPSGGYGGAPSGGYGGVPGDVPGILPGGAPHGVLPLPPLARSAISTWSLAPWRGRTTDLFGRPLAPLAPVASPAAPSWAFAPPVSKRAGIAPLVSGATTGRAAQDLRGCWLFTPSAQCARTD
ncbi:hypothetical protein N5079_05585 [Planotetraspora sp. A-T 1434]|uniref:hypothetical protein n=1 Tax=Planotetraspora sp. A-T 1434 TaxID=2979219 RepID=UPI0021BE7FC3|nr:hypothetical protein [Planotetraspora sp. A-T 1434]MCT9929691.1 hypothetical protein [Planotetraspora sp. A-T 1434]